MKSVYDILTRFAASLSLAVVTVACAGDSGEPPQPPQQAASSIRVNTAAVGVGVATRAAADDTGRDDTFMMLFWRDAAPLETADADYSDWARPYLASHAPQSVPFYGISVYDTTYPYPADKEDEPIYATGYAPGSLIYRDLEAGYRKLAVKIDDPMSKGRYDFLGCDIWKEVYKGSLPDPFAQEKNKLYFRHLAAKLKFFADREKPNMEKRQYVRNVKVKNLRMSIDGGQTWIDMHTPSAFEWRVLAPEKDFTTAYWKAIRAVRVLPGNEGASDTYPKAGYAASGSEEFAGEGSGYVLARENTDLVPVSGYDIDSCFVCNPIIGGVEKVDKPIRLKMDISAEMSYDISFPEPDNELTTDNLTFVREWNGVSLSVINKVDDLGNVVKGSEVDRFVPGNEYRVYIHFSLTGVDIVASELPWEYTNSHYIPILGGDKR